MKCNLEKYKVVSPESGGSTEAFVMSTTLQTLELLLLMEPWIHDSMQIQ